MTKCTDCAVKNNLDFEMIIQGNVAWIYDNEDEFFGDFKINFCPICGTKLKDMLSNGEDQP